MIEDEKLKRQYALYLIKHKEPYKAARALFPNDMRAHLYAAKEWTHDQFVVDLINEYNSENPEEILPTKTEYAMAVWNRMQNAAFDDDFAKLAKLYGEVRGFIEKPQTNVNIDQSVNTNKVLVVKDKGTDEDWQKGLLQQQKKLIEESRN